MARGPAEELWGAFRAALGEVGVTAHLALEPHGDRGWDAVGTIEDVPVVVEIQTVPTVGDVLALGHREASDAYRVLIARRVSKNVAATLADQDMGFFD